MINSDFLMVNNLQNNTENQTNKSFRSKIEELWLKFVRLYTFHTPIAKGKHRAYMFALKFCKNLPTKLDGIAKDGRKFDLNLTTGMHTTLFFLGEYEKALTEVVQKILRKGDVCLDVGANFGWYSTLFYKNCGKSAQIHAFEPVPTTFEELQRNYELLGSPKNVYLNNFALGDKSDVLTISLFEGLTTGHASLSNQGRDVKTSFECEVKTLDSYLKEKNVPEVNFVKVDIEGAEMMFLKGADKLFKQEVPPIWLMEMALQQTRNFGYLPDDLLKYMRSKADYVFFKIDEINTKLIAIEKIEKDDIGANFICFPKGHYPERFESLKSYF